MKNLIVYCLAPLLLLAACRKDAKIAPIVPNKTQNTVFPTDSISYTVDGKTYTSNNAGQVTAGNTEADRKVDSVVDLSHYYISGRKDSIFFYRTFHFSGGGSFDISFFRKYAVKDMVSNLIYYPASQGDLFNPGNYKYGTDFTRENATNGVALAVGSAGQTYSSQTLGIPVSITPASENNARFQVLSFKQLSNDQYTTQYVLEAKFDATLFDDNGVTKQLSNGYARVIIAVAHQ
ncbi:MAG: hypothetical protein ACHQHN_16955 [Sphingobacteriales bacterium]